MFYSTGLRAVSQNVLVRKKWLNYDCGALLLKKVSLNNYDYSHGNALHH